MVGSFGVPTFYITNPSKKLTDAMFFGTDRLHFVQQALGNPRDTGAPLTLPRVSVSKSPTTPRKPFRFFFDFSSPWSFLGWTQLHRLTSLGDVELVPILLGALFKHGEDRFLWGCVG